MRKERRKRSIAMIKKKGLFSLSSTKMSFLEKIRIGNIGRTLMKRRLNPNDRRKFLVCRETIIKNRKETKGWDKNRDTLLASIKNFNKIFNGEF